MKKNQSVIEQIIPNSKSVMKERQQSDFDFNAAKVLPILASNASTSPTSKRLDIVNKAIQKGANLSSLFVNYLLIKIYQNILYFINIIKFRKISKQKWKKIELKVEKLS